MLGEMLVAGADLLKHVSLPLLATGLDELARLFQAFDQL